MEEENYNNKNKINYILGKGKKKTYLTSLRLNLLYILIALTISVLLYEGSYDFQNTQISSLDNTSNNPYGLWFFKFGFIIGGLWFIPIALFIWRSLLTHNRFVGHLNGILYITSGIGMILVAFFPVRASKNMHLVGAVLGFGGLVIATLVSLLFLIVKIFTHYNKKMLSIGGFYFLPFVAVCILTFIYSGLPLLESFRRGIPFGDFTPDVWEIFEWGMLLSGLLTTIGILKLSTYQQSNKQQI